MEIVRLVIAQKEFVLFRRGDFLSTKGSGIIWKLRAKQVWEVELAQHSDVTHCLRGFRNNGQKIYNGNNGF